MEGEENTNSHKKSRIANRSTVVPWLVAFLVFAIFMPLYYSTAKRRATIFNTNSSFISSFDSTDTEEVKNHVIFHHDQHVYMNLGRLLKRADYDYFVPRQRTPGYPLLLSLLYNENKEYVNQGDDDPRRISDEQFAIYREFNIILSMALLVVLFFFGAYYLDVYASLLLTWICGWTLFLFKCIYVQPELLYYTLFLMSFVVLWKQIRYPTWNRGIAAGFLVAATYFIKSAIPPLLLLFTVCFAMRRFTDLYAAKKLPDFSWKAWFSDVGKGAIVPVIWLIVLSPYFVETAKVYKNPFWSVHTQHLMWQENASTKKKWRILSDPEIEIPADAPTFASYWEDHKSDPGHFIDRPLEGADNTLNRIGVEYREGHRLLKKRMLRLCVFMGILFFFPIVYYFRSNWIEMLYLFGFFLGYGTLYGWMEIIRAGPRLMLSLYPCAVFVMLGFLYKFCTVFKSERFKFRFPMRPVSYLVVATCLLIAIYNIIGKGDESAAWLIVGGS